MLQLFPSVLSDHAGLQLDAFSKGLFLLKDPNEGKEILEHN
jgi:hypothetical protein